MLELLRTRRSIRKYSNRKIDNDTENQIKEAVLRSPSSRGLNPWEFIFVDEKSIIKQLSLSKKQGSDFLEHAPIAIVVLGNENKSDVWIEDCSIASIVIQLTAHSLGLGSCWIQIRNRYHSPEISSENFVQKLLGIPEYMRVLSIIGIGYPDESPKPHSKESPAFSKNHYNTYKQV